MHRAREERRMTHTLSVFAYGKQSERLENEAIEIPVTFFFGSHSLRTTPLQQHTYTHVGSYKRVSG